MIDSKREAIALFGVFMCLFAALGTLLAVGMLGVDEILPWTMGPLLTLALAGTVYLFTSNFLAELRRLK